MSGRNIDAPDLGAALHALVRQDVQALLDALGDMRSPHRGVHEARKAIRRLRSLLLLGRKRFDAEGKRLDDELGTLATGLSDLRDAHVVVDAAGTLVRGHHDGKAHARWIALQRQLSRRRKQVLDRTLADDPRFARRRDSVALHGAMIDLLPWQALDRDAVRRELARSLRRMRKAGKEATRRDADAGQRHRWRRRLRRLRMQWNALKTLQKHAGDPGVRADIDALLAWLHTQAPRFGHIEKSTDALGAAQDLILLRAAIDHLPRTHALGLALQDIDALRNNPE